MIRKLPGRNVWVLKSKTSGRVLGRFPSKTKAVARERQIVYFRDRFKR
jgi:hypothetical protein